MAAATVTAHLAAAVVTGAGANITKATTNTLSATSTSAVAAGTTAGIKRLTQAMPTTKIAAVLKPYASAAYPVVDEQQQASELGQQPTVRDVKLLTVNNNITIKAAMTDKVDTPGADEGADVLESMALSVPPAPVANCEAIFVAAEGGFSADSSPVAPLYSNSSTQTDELSDEELAESILSGVSPEVERGVHRMALLPLQNRLTEIAEESEDDSLEKLTAPLINEQTNNAACEQTNFSLVSKASIANVDEIDFSTSIDILAPVEANCGMTSQTEGEYVCNYLNNTDDTGDFSAKYGTCDDYNGGDGTATTSCTYQERIIDYDNLRIIEHVIDCAHEVSTKCYMHVRNVKCENVSKNCKLNFDDNKDADSQVRESASDESDKVDMRLENDYGTGDNADDSGNVSNNMKLQPELNEFKNSSESNFACRELVAFIGESYQIIDNGSAPKVLHEEKPTWHEADDEDEYCASPVSTATNGDNNASPGSVDNNNNNRRVSGNEDAARLLNSLMQCCNRPQATSLTVLMTAESDGGQNTDANSTATTQIATASTTTIATTTVAPAVAAAANVAELATPAMTLALKALKSKLTPLAPPFLPAAAKAKQLAAASTGAATQSVYAYAEQTAIYYQQQQHQQQQSQQLTQLQQVQQQQQCLQLQQHTTTTSMLQTLNLQQSPTSSLYQQQQQRNAQPQSQQLQLQQQQQQRQQQLQHSFLTQQCLQHNLSTLPHIHLPTALNLPSAATPLGAAAAAAGGGSQHPQLYPVQVISLTAPTAAGTLQHGLPFASQPGNSAAAVVAAASGSAWPLLEAAPVYIDANGEFRTICPTHGTAAPAVGLPATAAVAATAATPPASLPMSTLTGTIAAAAATALPAGGNKGNLYPQQQQEQQQLAQQHQFNNTPIDSSFAAAVNSAAAQSNTARLLQAQSHSFTPAHSSAQQHQINQQHQHHKQSLSAQQQQQQQLTSDAGSGVPSTGKRHKTYRGE